MKLSRWNANAFTHLATGRWEKRPQWKELPDDECDVGEYVFFYSRNQPNGQQCQHLFPEEYFWEVIDVGVRSGMVLLNEGKNEMMIHTKFVEEMTVQCFKEKVLNKK